MEVRRGVRRLATSRRTRRRRTRPSQESGRTFTRQVDELPPPDVLAEIDAKVDMQKLEETLMEEGLTKFADPQKALLEADRREAGGAEGGVGSESPTDRGRVGSSVRETPVGVEPTSSRFAGGRPAVRLQRRECPRQESNLAFDLRRVACLRHTPGTPDRHPAARRVRTNPDLL